MNHRRNNRPSAGSGTMGRTGEHSRTVLHSSCLITDPSTGSGILCAGSVSIVEPFCIYLANHGPFDAAQGSYGQDR